MLLGLNLSHDASAAATNNNGEALFSVGEERISRVKNHVGLPLEALTQILNATDDDVTEVVIGSHQQLSISDLYMMLASVQGNPSNPVGSFQKTFPSFAKLSKSENRDPKLVLQEYLIEQHPERLKNTKFIWEKHHDSHLGCAMAASFDEKTLLVSLDGDGDGESGAISIGNRFGISQELARFSELDSLGHLYSAITQRYNFKPNRHEGKITGLAAFGSYSSAVEVILRYVHIENGVPSLSYGKSVSTKFISELLNLKGQRSLLPRYLSTIADLAEENTSDYPDLAYAIQYVLEKSVLEIVSYWVKKTGVSNISLAGGVFSNVKLNQRISDLESVKRVNVFPNMGDGGLALGGIWANLAKQNSLSGVSLYNDMYLAPKSVNRLEKTSTAEFDVQKVSESEGINLVVDFLCEKRLVGVHLGRMEFGPRALGNRTLLIDPRDGRINTTVNERLQRTEFMPFAPMVLEEKFQTFFSTNNLTLEPFKYMAMTCDVREEYRDVIPAVTHVDGTARPQIVTRSSNPICHQILLEFEKRTGLGVLVNTSLNIHEEPINYGLGDSLEALRRGAIDCIFTGSEFITVRDKANSRVD